MTNAVIAALEAVAEDLDDAGVRWALIGGFAVSARSEPRFTRDVDVAVAVGSDAEAEAVVAGLVNGGYAIAALVEHEPSGRLATVRLSSPAGSGTLVDLLFASSGIETEIASASSSLEILPGLTMPVARAGHLVVLKLLARDDEARPQDAADLRALRAVLDPDDLALAQAAAAAVVERGFHRDRDLPGQLQAYLALA